MVVVAAAQITVVEDISVNCKKIKQYITKAAKKKVDIVCFPETALNPNDNPSYDPSEQLEEIKVHCKKESIWCIVGAYMPHKNKVKNSIFLINNKGNIEYRYDKVHLYSDEKKTVLAGRTNKPIKTTFATIGIIDCWDFAFSEYSKKLAKKGATIIFCPSYLVSYKKDGEVLRNIPLVKAFENISYYVSCDAFTNETLGESFISHPQKTLKQIKGKEELIYADIDVQEIKKLRKEYDHLS